MTGMNYKVTSSVCGGSGGGIGKDANKGSGRPQIGGKVLQGGDTGGTFIWLRGLLPIGCNVDNNVHMVNWAWWKADRMWSTLKD